MKLVFVINGKGGIGKDTFCEMVAKSGYKVLNISSITPIKDIAKVGGWTGQKQDKDRKFLADLKQLFTEYNSLPNNYCVEKYKMFMQSNDDIMFVHIRELKEIKHFVDSINGNCLTLLIKKSNNNHIYGNESDDNAENYNYDYVYYNDKPLEEMQSDVASFISNIIKEQQK